MKRDGSILLGLAGATAVGAYLLRRHLGAPELALRSGRTETAPQRAPTAKRTARTKAVPDVGLDGFLWPVPTLLDRGELRKPRVSSGFGMRGKRFHWGVDILYPRKAGEPRRSPHGSKRHYMPAGVPAIAVADGIVTVAYAHAGGGAVRIDHGGGIKTDYLHLDPHLVARGERVRAGKRVGMIGWDKRRRGDLYHLHFQVWVDGKRVDPEPYLKRWRRSATIAAENTRRVA